MWKSNKRSLSSSLAIFEFSLIGVAIMWTQKIIHKRRFGACVWFATIKGHGVRKWHIGVQRKVPTNNAWNYIISGEHLSFYESRVIERQFLLKRVMPHAPRDKFYLLVIQRSPACKSPPVFHNPLSAISIQLLEKGCGQVSFRVTVAVMPTVKHSKIPWIRQTVYRRLMPCPSNSPAIENFRQRQRALRQKPKRSIQSALSNH